MKYMTPSATSGVETSPRAVFHALIEPRIRAGNDYRDVVVNRVVGTGDIAGTRTEIVLDVINHRPSGLLGPRP